MQNFSSICQSMKEKSAENCTFPIFWVQKEALLLQKLTQSDDTLTWSVVHLNKVMCKSSAPYVKACRWKVRKTGRRRPGRTESRTDGDLDGYHHTIIRPVWRQAYKKSRGWLWNTTVCPHGGNKVEKAIFSFKVKVKSQGHWPWCHLKGHH